MAIRPVGLTWYLAALVAVCITATHASRAQQPLADSTRRDSLPAVLMGRVTDSAGVGLPGAELTLFHSDKVHSITGDSGEFRITGLPPGTNVFNVRRLGFEPASFTALLKPGKTHRATLSLTATAHTLPTIAVADTAQKTHWLDQFERRKSSAPGVFFTRADIERKGARIGTDVVRNVPGIRLVPVRGGAGYRVVMNRGAGGRTCFPQMFYHNTPYSGDLDDFIAEDIEAVEVYVGVSEIPPELDKGGKGICGAIVVWTRDPKRRP